VPDISYPSIPDPNIDPGAMLNTLTRLKETVELMTGQTQDQRFSFPNQTKIIERRTGTALARFTEQLQIQANSLGAVVTAPRPLKPICTTPPERSRWKLPLVPLRTRRWHPASRR
jgi:hypothetical protein